MSLFNEIAKTKVEKRYEQIKVKSPKILLGEKNRCKATFDLMWNDMSLEEAQELIDMMGAEAVQAFQMHAKWQEFILAADPSYVALVPPFAYEIVDGAVVLSEIETE